MDTLEVMKALFLTPRNLIIIAMAWSLALMIGKMLPNRWVKGYRMHVAPAVMLVVCSASVWVSGLRPGLPEGKEELAKGTGISGEEIGWRIALGIILALLAYVLPVFMMWFAEKKLPPNVVKNLRKILL